MAVVQHNLEAEMRDKQTHAIVADQSDVAEWEMQPFYAPERHTVAVRFFAYSALLREGKFKGSWEKFKKECLEVRVARTKGQDEVDPTQSDQPQER
jgi:hypothetical protein